MKESIERRKAVIEYAGLHHWALKGRFQSATLIAESESARDKAAILKHQGTYFLVVKKVGGHRSTKMQSKSAIDCIDRADEAHRSVLALKAMKYCAAKCPAAGSILIEVFVNKLLEDLLKPTKVG